MDDLRAALIALRDRMRADIDYHGSFWVDQLDIILARVAEDTMIPREALEGLRDKLRHKAQVDAKAGVKQVGTSNREYYGLVNAALAYDECADELDALLAAPQAEEGWQPTDVIEACARYLERNYRDELMVLEMVAALRDQAWGPILPAPPKE